MPLETLAARWSSLAAGLGMPADLAADAYRAIVLAYSQAHRAYHDLRHVAQVFAALDSVPVVDDALEVAVWFHDFVYRPGYADNEKESAEAAGRLLAKIGADSTRRARVEQLILATRQHGAERSDEKLCLFLDADLSILGADPAAYDRYAAAVRREFEHIPAPLHRRGRVKFLEGMLGRDAVFLSAFFQDRLEAHARANLQRELASLGA